MGSMSALRKRLQPQQQAGIRVTMNYRIKVTSVQPVTVTDN